MSAELPKYVCAVSITEQSVQCGGPFSRNSLNLNCLHPRLPMYCSTAVHKISRLRSFALQEMVED